MTGSDRRPIRVTFVLPSFAGGGAERVVLTLARRLDRTRFSPRLIVLDRVGPLQELVAADVPVTNLSRPRLRHAWRALAKALRETDSDVVVPTVSHVNLAVLMMRRHLAPGSRTVVRESNTPSASLSSTGSPALWRWLYRRYCPRADAIMCPSGMVADEFVADFGVARDRVAVLPHPVDVDLVRGESTPPIRAAGSGARFVAAGRMTRQKGFDRLIDLLPGLPADAQVTLLGEGPELEALQRRAAGLGVEHRLAFAGFVNNPWQYYAGADAFLLPSRWEGMPNAALEALAVGTPVIARSEAGGIREVDASDGAVTTVDTDAAFAAAMRDVSPRDPEAARPSLLPGRFALDAVMAEFEALLTRVVAGEPAQI